MTNQAFVAVTMDDGSLTIMAFMTEGRSPTLPSGASWLGNGRWQRPAISENIEAELAKTFPGVNTLGIRRPKPVSWRIVPEQFVPQTKDDRAYRNALTDVGTLPFAHNMTKAREIHRDKLRHARARKFAELDAEYLRADEAGDQAEKRRVTDQKQRLRDLPADPAIEAAQTIEQLKAFWPPELA